MVIFDCHGWVKLIYCKILRACLNTGRGSGCTRGPPASVLGCQNTQWRAVATAVVAAACLLCLHRSTSYPVHKYKEKGHFVTYKLFLSCIWWLCGVYWGHKHDQSMIRSPRKAPKHTHAVAPQAWQLLITFLLLDQFKQMNMKKKHNKKCSSVM